MTIKKQIICPTCGLIVDETEIFYDGSKIVCVACSDVIEGDPGFRELTEEELGRLKIYDEDAGW
jgi:formylmethanofuran dehydrogenase subunit B